jgi:chromosome segregation ATPase
MKLKSVHIVIIVAVGLLIVQNLFMGNSYKKEYMKMLKEQEQTSKKEIERLQGSVDSLKVVNSEIEKEIAKVDSQLDAKDSQIKKLKKQHEKDVAKFDSMSDDELTSAFTDAFK